MTGWLEPDYDGDKPAWGYKAGGVYDWVLVVIITSPVWLTGLVVFAPIIHHLIK